MKKVAFSLALLLALCGAFSGCSAPAAPSSSSAPASSSSSSAPEPAVSAPASSSTPKAPAPPIVMTQALMDEMLACTAASWKDFYATHPDFLRAPVILSPYGTIQDGSVVSLEVHSTLRLEDLPNRPRLAKFVENYHAGIADCIVTLSTRDPLPLWATVYTYDGKGKSYTVQGYGPDIGKFNSPATTVAELVETDTYWILLDDEKLQERYTKHGYQAIPLGENKGQVTREAAYDALLAFLKEHAPKIAVLAPPIEEELEFGGELYYAFEGMDAQGSSATTVWAVAKDLRQFFEIEHGMGTWLLQSTPLAGPGTPAGTAPAGAGL